MPPLLVEFSKWAENKLLGSIGDFDIEGSRLSDWWAVEFGDLYPHFAPFLHIGDGSLVAFWMPEGVTNDSPPFAYIGSEGELRLLANSLEQFLAHLAAGNTSLQALDPRRPTDDSQLRELPDEIRQLFAHMAAQPKLYADPDDQRESLASWLSSRGIPPPATARIIPDLNEWFEVRNSEREAFRNRDAIRLEIAERLRHFTPPPPDAPGYWRECFDVLVVGNWFQMWHRYRALIPLPSDLAADLKPLVRADRERRARRHPERGLWFTSWLTINRAGGAQLHCNFYDLPKIFNTTPDIALEDYRADLAAFPRAQYWMPPWLKQKLDT